MPVNWVMMIYGEIHGGAIQTSPHQVPQVLGATTMSRITVGTISPLAWAKISYKN